MYMKGVKRSYVTTRTREHPGYLCGDTFCLPGRWSARRGPLCGFRCKRRCDTRQQRKPWRWRSGKGKWVRSSPGDGRNVWQLGGDWKRSSRRKKWTARWIPSCGGNGTWSGHCLASIYSRTIRERQERECREREKRELRCKRKASKLHVEDRAGGAARRVFRRPRVGAAFRSRQKRPQAANGRARCAIVDVPRGENPARRTSRVLGEMLRRARRVKRATHFPAVLVRPPCKTREENRMVGSTDQQ